MRRREEEEEEEEREEVDEGAGQVCQTDGMGT
jgi:hypothetical protein